MTVDITDPGVRQKIIEEIGSDENLERKEESFARFEVYRERQSKYIYGQLQRELGGSRNDLETMRTVTSINFTRKMISELASIYKYEPMRTFDGLTEAQEDLIHLHYQHNRANVKLKKSNRLYKLHEQGAIQTIPKDGMVDFRVLQPHHYDVVPAEDDQERGEVYIVSNFDRTDWSIDRRCRRPICDRRGGDNHGRAGQSNHGHGGATQNPFVGRRPPRSIRPHRIATRIDRVVGQRTKRRTEARWATRNWRPSRSRPKRTNRRPPRNGACRKGCGCRARIAARRSIAKRSSRI